jgi:hypothetical protein
VSALVVSTAAAQPVDDRDLRHADPPFVDFRDVWLAYNEEAASATTSRSRTST